MVLTQKEIDRELEGIAPLGLEEWEPRPITVWKFNLPSGMEEWCFISEEDAYHSGPSDFFGKPCERSEPLEWTLSSLLAACVTAGSSRLVVSDRTLRVIEEYPL